MPIEFACKGCGTRYRVNDNLAGRSAKCRHCGQTMTVPKAEPAEPENQGIAFHDGSEPEAPRRPAPPQVASPVTPAREPEDQHDEEQHYAFKDQSDEDGGADDSESSEGGDGSDVDFDAPPDVDAVMNEFALREPVVEEKSTRVERIWPLIPDIASEVILPPLLTIAGIGGASALVVMSILHSSNKLLGFILLVASLLLYFFGVVPVALKAIEAAAKSAGFALANSIWQQTAGLLAIPTAMMVLGYRGGGTSGLVSFGAMGLAIMCVLIVLVYRTGVVKSLAGVAAAAIAYVFSGAAAVAVLAALCFVFFKAGATMPWERAEQKQVAKVEEKKEEKPQEAPKPVAVEEKPKVEEAPKPVEPAAPPKPVFVWAPVADSPPNYGPGKFSTDPRMIEVKTPLTLAHAASGSPFVAWVDQVAFHIYDLRSGRRVGFIKDPTLPAGHTLISPDGALAAVARFAPPNIRVATSAGSPGGAGAGRMRAGGLPSASLAPGGGSAGGMSGGAPGGAGGMASGPQIEIWGANDTRSSRRITFDATRPAPAVLGFTKNNQLITAANVNGKSAVQVWDTKTAQAIREFEAVAAVAMPDGCALSASGRYIAAIEAGHLFVYDTEAGAQVCDIEPPHALGMAKAISFSHDGSQLAIVLSEGVTPNLLVLNTADGSVALDTPLPGGSRADLSCDSFVWVPAGGALVLGSDWIDTKTGKIVATVPPQSAGASTGRVKLMISDHQALIEFLPAGSGAGQRVIYRTVALPKKEIDAALADRRTRGPSEEITSAGASATPGGAAPITVPTGDPRTLIKAASDSLAAGKDAEALAIAQAVIEKFPKNPKPLTDEQAIAYHQAAVAAMRMNDLAKAREMMDKALAYNKTSRALIINAAKLDIAQQNYVARAARELDKLLAVSVDEETLNLLGAACAKAEQDPRLANQVLVFAANYDGYNKKLEATKPGMRRWGVKWMPEAEFQAISHPPEIVEELTAAQARVKAANIEVDKCRKALVEAKKQSRFDERKTNIERDASRKNQPMYVSKAEDAVAAAQREAEDAKSAVETANAKFPKPEFEANLEPIIPELTLVG